MSRQPQECATGSMKIAARSLPCFLTSSSAISSSLNGATIVFAAFSGKAPAETGIAFISFDDPNCSGDGLTDSAGFVVPAVVPALEFHDLAATRIGARQAHRVIQRVGSPRHAGSSSRRMG